MRLTWLFLFLFPFACAACSVSGQSQVSQPPPQSDGGGDAALPPGLSASDATAVCTTLYTAWCQHLLQCSATFFHAEYADNAECVQSASKSCAAYEQLPGVTMTQAAASTCAQNLQAAACSVPLREVNGCLLKGVLDLDQRCFDDSQCASGVCQIDPNGCGTCGAGWPATAPSSCSTSSDCPEFMSCGSQGKCVEAGKAKGEDCSQRDSCNQFAGLSCVLGQCFQATQLVMPPASCGADGQMFTDTLCTHGYCSSRQGGTDVCVTQVPEGQACDPQQGPFCMQGYACDPSSKTCGLPAFDSTKCG